MNIIQKTRDDYNKIAKHFASTRFQGWPELEQFKPLLKNGQRILDWGCGNGRLLTFLEGRDIRYVGIDQSKELLKIAKKKYTELIKQKKVAFFCTANRAKKFPGNYFDLVFMVASFHHLPNRETRLKLLKQVYKELKPGGRLIITVWNLESDWAKNKLKKDWKKVGKNDFLIPWKNPEGKVEVERYYHSTAPEELRELLEVSGFFVEQLDYYNGGVRWTDSNSKGGRNLVAVSLKKISLGGDFKS